MPASKALSIMNDKKITSLLVVSNKDYKKPNKILKGIFPKEETSWVVKGEKMQNQNAF